MPVCFLLIKLFKPTVMTTPMWAFSATADAAAQPDLSRVWSPGPSETDQSINRSVSLKLKDTDCYCDFLKLFSITGGSCHKYHFCHDKPMFVATNTCLSWQNTSFVVTEVCLWQIFVATNIVLLQQKLYLWHLPPMIFLFISMSWTAEHRPPHFKVKVQGF